MRHLQVGKRTVRKTAASVGEHQIRRQSFSDVAAFVRISEFLIWPKRKTAQEWSLLSRCI
jgi:hypothetical protein